MSETPYFEIIPNTITTSNTSRPVRPSLIIKNPLDTDTIVNLIEIIPSDDFSTKGKMVIEINGLRKNDDDDFFSGYRKYPLSLDAMLKRSGRIEIFAWNDTDSSSISCDVICHFSLKNKNLSAITEELTGKPLVGTALSSATNTIYTCPSNKKARVFGQILLDGYGAASLVALQIDSSPIEEWQIANFSESTSYDAVSGDSFWGKAVGQSFSQYRKRIIDIKLAAGQVLKKTQNVGDNATLYYSLKVIEEKA